MRDPDSEYAPFVLSVTDDTVIQPGDHVLLFVPHRRLVPAVEKLFRVKATFF
jgi:trk system potassium uptake protein TrkA